MTRTNLRRAASGCVILTLWSVVAPACLAAEATRRSTSVDMELSPNGLLVGRAFDERGVPAVHQEVSLAMTGHVVATTRTDEQGVFAVTGLRGGSYAVTTGPSTYLVRLWAPGTAPPSAFSGVLTLGPESTVRGQWGAHSNYWINHTKVWATNPFVIGGIIAAAVAIPVIIHNNDDDHS